MQNWITHWFFFRFHIGVSFAARTMRWINTMQVITQAIFVKYTRIDVVDYHQIFKTNVVVAQITYGIRTTVEFTGFIKIHIVRFEQECFSCIKHFGMNRIEGKSQTNVKLFDFLCIHSTNIVLKGCYFRMQKTRSIVAAFVIVAIHHLKKRFVQKNFIFFQKKNEPRIGSGIE